MDAKKENKPDREGCSKMEDLELALISNERILFLNNVGSSLLL